MLYMFRTPFASIIRSTINCNSSHWCHELGWNKSCIDVQDRLCTVLFHGQIGTAIPTHDKHQWLLLQFIVLLMMDAKGVRNMQSIIVVVNKHNTARVASCWFIIYYFGQLRVMYINQPNLKHSHLEYKLLGHGVEIYVSAKN